MAKKMCSYRFDDEFIRLLEALTGLERTSKTQVIQKAVMNYMSENMDRLEKRYKQMKKLDLLV
jgi:hypothetical protein